MPTTPATTSSSYPVEWSDSELAQRIIAGDEAAMCVLMRRHNQTLYRAARSILHDDAESEDVVQDTYVHAYQAMASFRGDAQLSTWLTRISIIEQLGRPSKQRRRREINRLDDCPETKKHQKRDDQGKR